MTTILNPSKLPEDEEKIRKILRELREKNVNMEHNISKLENTLQDPAFQNITGKLYMCSNLNPNNNEDDQLIRRIGRCRQIIAPKTEGLLKNFQHLVFLAVNPHQQNPEIHFQSSHDANGNSLGFSLAHYVVVGPKSFRKRPKNWLRIGDRIISVDYSLISELVIDSTHESAKQLFISKNSCDQSNKSGLLEQSSNYPIFGIIRDKFDAHLMALTGDWTQIQVVHLPNEPTVGLGFGIVGGASTGVVVKTILPGSAADKDGRLKPGDRILQIGRINVQGMSSQQVAGLLRQPEPIIELIVGRPINVTDTVADSLSCWTMATRAALNPTSLEEHIQQRINSMQNGNLRKDSHPKTPLTTIMTNDEVEVENVKNNNHDNVNSNAIENEEHNQEIKPSTSQTSNLDEIKKRPDSTDSKNKSRSTSTDRPISLKNLQEMALTTFLRENWIDGQYEQVEVELHRDPNLGLGITVAGYVHKKEEINGVFVKSLVPNSSAHLSNKIRVHDLIISVNDQSLENLSHSQSVKTLVKSGNRVLLKMIRFFNDSPQAICLKMLHEQETDTQIVDVQSTLLDYKHYWQTKLGNDYEVISVIIKPDKNDMDGGLGVSLEGTVDVIDGTQLCPHHYIESLRKDGPAAKIGLLKSGDELLQVNDQVLYGESHVTVRQALSKAAANAEQKDVRLTLCRKAQQINLYMPSPEQSLPLAYSLLATIDDRIVKAKSESALNLEKTNETGYFLKEVARKLKSRSLEHLSGLAIWNCVPIVVTLEKDSRGLGFSVIDYQDPLHPNETVIVIRALVPGGIAQADGRIVPGDRLLFVNSTDLSRATLDRAVAVLKATPPGLVRLGIAKPVPVDQLHFGTHSPIISRSERLLAKGTSPRSRRRRPKLTSSGVSGASSQEEVWIGADLYRKLNPQLYFPPSGSETPSTPRSHCSMLTWSPCSSRSLSPCGSPILQGSWGYDVIFLPKNLERSIKLMKGALALGIVVDAEIDKGINGCVIKSICSKKAIGRDGRLQIGDYLVKINTENLRNVTNSQAKAILKRTNLIGTQCNVTYITAADARLWKQHFHRETEQDQPVINRLSPKVFPKFYKSPFLDKKQSNEIKSKIMSGESSFDDDENPKYDESTTIEIAEKIGKQNATKIIDEIFIEKFADEVIQNALNDSYLELAVAEKVADWTTTKTSESLKRPENAFDSVLNFKSGSIQKIDEKEPEKIETEIEVKVESPEEEELPPPPPILPKISKPIEPVEPIFEPIPSTSKAMVAAVEETNQIKLNPPQHDQQQQQKQKKKPNFWGEARTVLLHREPGETFGISIVGGRVEVSQKGGLPGTGNTVTGIFIKSVMPESPAGKSGKMFMGDRVISVNDVDLKDATHEYAVQIIKAASNPVKFVVQSLQSFSAHQLAKNDRQQKIEIVHHTKEKDTVTETTLPVKEKIVENEKIEEKIEKPPKDDERHVRMAEDEPSHKPVTSQESTNSTRESIKKRRFVRLRESMRKKLDESSAAALPKNSDDPDEEDRFCYTPDKIKRKYGDLPGEPILIKLENIPPKGLGLSLAGNRDREKNSVFVVDIKSTSPLPLKVGDELLEINGKVLFGLSHVTATSKIRECCEGDELALLILRRIDALDEMATNKQGTTILNKKNETEGIPILASSSSATPPVAAVTASTDLSQVEEKKLEINLKNENIPPTVVPVISTTPSTTTTTTTAAATNLSSSNNFDGGVTRKKSTTITQQQMEKNMIIETGKETWIEIDKDGKGLGLSIVGGSDTVLGTVVVHEVYSDGAAAVDGRLKPGDQLLEVNGSSLRDVSHEQAISILRRTPPKVKLLVYRDVNLQMSLLDPTQIYNIFSIELSKKPGRGLGLSIVGRKNEPGVYVSEIVKGGVAEQDGRLMQGDQILAVNGTDVTNLMQEDVATMLKTCTGKVTLKIGRWKLTETANKVHAAAPPSMSSPHITRNANNNVISENNNFNDIGPTPTTPRTVREEIKENGLKDEKERKDVPPPAPPSWPQGSMPEVMIQDENQVVVHPDLSPVTEEPGSQNDLKSLGGENDQPITSQQPMKEINFIPDWHEEGSDDVLIALKKIDGQQWGMGIGKRARGILITSLQPGSTAAEKLKVGDRIMGVNGEKVIDQHSAVTLVKASGNCVVLQVARPINRPSSGNL